MQLRGRQKVAAYLLSLDTQAAVEVINGFEPEEIAAITQDMLALKHLDGDTVEAIRKEFDKRIADGKPLGIHDTSAAAGRLLEAALGPERSQEVLGGRSVKASRRPPFEALNDLEAGQLVAMLSGEHPQIVAVVLSYIKPTLAAAVLSDLPESIHAEIVTRMTKTEATSHDLLNDIELLLCQKADHVASNAAAATSGSSYKAVAGILNMVGKDVRKSVLDHLGESEPDTAQEIENMMFVFEDLSQIDDRAMQRVLREVDNQTLSLSLKSASEEMKKKVFDNLSKRAAESMAEEMEMMGPKPVSEVEAAQREILEIARRLDEAGEIALRQGEQEAMV